MAGNATRDATRNATRDATYLPGEKFLAFKNDYSLNFDGTDDFVDLGASSTFFSTNVNSISMWFKMPDTSGGEERIFVSNSDAGSSDLRVVISTGGTISVDIWNGSGLVSTTGGSAIDDDLWHHLVYTTNASAQALYIDGVSVATTTHTRSSRAGSVSATIGAYVTGNQYAEVDVDEVAIWDKGLSASEVAGIYNGGIPTDLTKNGGGYVSSSDLQSWWRNGDATIPADDGTNGFIFDQADTGLGADIITNGTFDSSVSGWSASSGGTVTWSAGTAVTAAIGTDDRGGMSQTNTTVNGAVYELTFDVVSRTSTKWEVYRQGSGGPGTIVEGTALGSHSVFFTAAATSTQLAFYAKQAGTTDGEVAWDNISCKKVNGATATINGPTIQAETP